MRSVQFIVGLFLLAGCAAPIETKPVSAPLAPAAVPERQVGDRFTYLTHAGEEVDQDVVSVNGHEVSWQSTDGWQWTALTPFGGNSSIAWKSPEGEGQQTYANDLGALFPLEVGKTATTSYEGINDGGAFRGRQRCAVQDEVQVEVLAGTFDTFVVVCQRGSNPSNPYSTRTYYYAPEVGVPVIAVIEEQRRSTRSHELVRHTPATLVAGAPVRTPTRRVAERKGGNHHGQHPRHSG